MKMYINTGKVIGQDFETMFSFRRKEAINEIEFYDIIYKNFGYNEDGTPRMIKIELIAINEVFNRKEC